MIVEKRQQRDCGSKFEKEKMKEGKKRILERAGSERRQPGEDGGWNKAK
jgi:hypothetical protein